MAGAFWLLAAWSNPVAEGGPELSLGVLGLCSSFDSRFQASARDPRGFLGGAAPSVLDPSKGLFTPPMAGAAAAEGFPLTSDRAPIAGALDAALRGGDSAGGRGVRDTAAFTAGGRCGTVGRCAGVGALGSRKEPELAAGFGLAAGFLGGARGETGRGGDFLGSRSAVVGSEAGGRGPRTGNFCEDGRDARDLPLSLVLACGGETTRGVGREDSLRVKAGSRRPPSASLLDQFCGAPMTRFGAELSPVEAALALPTLPFTGTWGLSRGKGSLTGALVDFRSSGGRGSLQGGATFLGMAPGMGRGLEAGALAGALAVTAGARLVGTGAFPAGPGNPRLLCLFRMAAAHASRSGMASLPRLSDQNSVISSSRPPGMSRDSKSFTFSCTGSKAHCRIKFFICISRNGELSGRPLLASGTPLRLAASEAF